MNEIHQPTFQNAARAVPSAPASSYDGVAIALHWTTAALVIANFALAQTWDWFPKPTRELMENTHMSFGVVLTVVIFARLAWRFIPGHQVASLEAGWMKVASKATHLLLYVMLVTEAGLGFAFRWGAGRPMAFFGLGIPPLIGELGKALRHSLRDIHEWNGWAIIVLAGLHAAAALYHHYVLKDRVLARMLPVVRQN